VVLPEKDGTSFHRSLGAAEAAPRPSR